MVAIIFVIASHCCPLVCTYKHYYYYFLRDRTLLPSGRNFAAKTINKHFAPTHQTTQVKIIYLSYQFLVLTSAISSRQPLRRYLNLNSFLFCPAASKPGD